MVEHIGYSTPLPSDLPSDRRVNDYSRPFVWNESDEPTEVDDLLPMEPGRYLPPADRMRWIRFLRPEIEPLTPTYIEKWVIWTWFSHGLVGLPYDDDDRRCFVPRDIASVHEDRARARFWGARKDWQDRKTIKHRVHGRFRRIAIARAGGRCHYCGCAVEPKDFEIDHVIPVSRGGRSRLSNLVAACKPCNRSKYDSLLSEWAPVLELRKELVRMTLADARA